MPISKTFLPDVNVWLALASRRHAHAVLCADWIGSMETGEILFCRVTQMSLLRLLTNTSVMGDEVLTSREAWRVYRTILDDARIGFAPEPFALEPDWKKLTSQDRPMPKIWTEAYLAAFARAGGMRLVTLDRAVLSIARDALLLK
jgi:toxin-antitoxin system PIN domain toxin